MIYIGCAVCFGKLGTCSQEQFSSDFINQLYELRRVVRAFDLKDWVELGNTKSWYIKFILY